MAGLKNYIKRIPEHLYLVDLICHGVPSQQMLHEHINHIMKGRSAVQLSFRKGQLYRIEMLSRCGTVYSSEPTEIRISERFWTEYHIEKAATIARLHARKE